MLQFLITIWTPTFAFFLIISKYKSFKLKNIITSYRKKLLSPCSRMTLKELINYIFLKGQFNISLHFRSKKRNQLNDKNFYFQDFTFPIYFSNFSLGCPPFNFVIVFLWIGCKIKILGWLLELRTACILYIEKWIKMAVKKRNDWFTAKLIKQWYIENIQMWTYAFYHVRKKRFPSKEWWRCEWVDTEE